MISHLCVTSHLCVIPHQCVNSHLCVAADQCVGLELQVVVGQAAFVVVEPVVVLGTGNAVSAVATVLSKAPHKSVSEIPAVVCEHCSES